MKNIIKKPLFWIILVIILLLIAYQMKWFGNTKTLFYYGGNVSRQQKLAQLKSALGGHNLPITLPAACDAWIYAPANNPNNAQLLRDCIKAMKA